MPPLWLTILAGASLVVAAACAGAIAWDMWGRGNRQPMRVMEAVWPVTALYLGPLALYGYWRWARPGAPDHGERVSVAFGVSHCGAGCTIGDVIGAFAVLALGWQLLGLALPAEYLVDFALAFTLGIVFQYLAIAPARGLGLRDGVTAALKADALSLLAFEVGLFAWMAFMQLVLFPTEHLAPDHLAYWGLMQVGMAIGFLTAYPANVWLVRKGIKEGM